MLNACLFRFFLCLAILAPAVADSALRIAVSGDTPTLFRIDEDNQPTGFNVDIAHSLCETMGKQCIFLSVHQDAKLIPALVAGEYDAIIASLPIPPEDQTDIIFTQRYYKNGVKFIRRKGDKTKISYKNLANKFVGVQSNTNSDDFLTAEFQGAAIQRYPTAPALYDALLAGEVDYVVADQFQQAAWINDKDDFQLSGPTYNKSQYFASVGIAVRQQDEALRQQLNDAIAAIRKTGQYRAINKSHFPFSIYGR